jgi:hypothetical protein
MEDENKRGRVGERESLRERTRSNNTHFIKSAHGTLKVHIEEIAR